MNEDPLKHIDHNTVEPNRIRELALEADTYCDKRYYGDSLYSQQWEMKFANLLVEEFEQYILESEGDIDYVRFLIQRNLKINKKTAAASDVDGNSKPVILSNKIKTPDGTILESFHRHDYKTYIDKNGLEYMVDGGLDYIRRIVHDQEPYIEMTVYSDDDHITVRESFKWGTRGIDGKQPVQYILLKDLNTDHVEAILDTQTQLSDTIRQQFVNELKFRKQDESTN